MPVPSLITDLSATAASNSPSGSEAPTEGDNHLRTAYAFIKQLYDGVSGVAYPTLARLASTANGDGTDLIVNRGLFATSYRKFLSDTLDFLPVNVLLCLPEAERAAIQAYTSTYDCLADLGNMMTTAATLRRVWLWWPEGKYCLSAALTVTNGSFKWTGYGRRSFGAPPTTATGTHIVALNNTGLLRIDPGVAYPTDILIESMGFYGTGAGSNIDGIIIDDAWGVTMRDCVVDFFSRDNISVSGTSGAYGLKLADVYSARAGRANAYIDASFCELSNFKSDGGQYGVLGTSTSQGLGINGEWHCEGATTAGVSSSGVRSSLSGGRVVGNTNATVGVLLAGAGSTMVGTSVYATTSSGATNSIGIDATGFECAISGVRSVADTALRASGALSTISGVFEGQRAGVELLTTSGNGDGLLHGFVASGVTNSVLHTSGTREWRIGAGLMLDAAAPGTQKALTVTAGIPLIEGMNSKPICDVRHSAAQAIASATYTAMAFDTDNYDNYNQHDTATNNSRITFKYSGRYRVSYSIQIASSATGSRTGRIRKNGATLLWNLNTVPGTGGGLDTIIQGSFVAAFDATEYIELEAYQDSGGSLNAQAGAGTSLTISLDGDS
jgi:hypothetical protein